MFLPIGDAPNPRGTPFVTYALVAINVAVFLMWNVPLGSRPADVNDPAFAEYVEVMARELSGRADVRQLVAQTSAYDLFSFEHGYRPAAAQVLGPAELHVPARRVHAPLREHALSLDLRRQRGEAPRGPALPLLVPRHRRRRDAHPRPRLLRLQRAAHRGLRSHLGHAGLLLRLLPAQHACGCSPSSRPS